MQKMKTATPFMKISIHVLRVEDDRIITIIHSVIISISIHVLRVEDDSNQHSQSGPNHHFNPRPPCGGRHFTPYIARHMIQISIHVLRVEDDSKNREKSLFAFI